MHVSDDDLVCIDWIRLLTSDDSTIKVARTNFSTAQIIANVKATLQGAINAIPSKWKNVQTIHLKAIESAALPLYQAIPASIE